MTAISSAPAAPEGRLRLTRDSLHPQSRSLPSLMYGSCGPNGWLKRPHRRDVGPVDSLSVSHLQRLGFKKETARNALVYARNDVALAIELAIHDSHPLTQNPDCPVCQGRVENNAMRQWFKDQNMRPTCKRDNRDLRLTILMNSTHSFGLMALPNASIEDSLFDSPATPRGPYSHSVHRSASPGSSRGSYSIHENFSNVFLEDLYVEDSGMESDDAGSEDSFGSLDGEQVWGEDETSLSMPLPTTPTSPHQFVTPPRSLYGQSPIPANPISISVPLNDDGPSRRYYSPTTVRIGVGSPSPELTKRQSRDNISYRTHSRVQSVSSFYGWYQSQNGSSGPTSGGSGSESAHSPVRARADSIGRAF